jgi:hypothetical protein
MGRDVTQAAFSREDRSRYRRKVRRCLDVFALMLNDFEFDADRPTTGLEIEINLVDTAGQPAMCNAEILSDLADPFFQKELGQFNLEINVPPRLIEGDGLEQYEREILSSLHHADKYAGRFGAHLALIGILPTLTQEHTVLDNLSVNPRFQLLNHEISEARGERFLLDIRGAERLRIHADSIAPESACTSTQFHLQVTPDNFPRYWNAAQSIAAVQVAVGANSPFLFGNQLWAETRVSLFEQAVDTRPDELKVQGVRPRVWFGERWITSIFDLFEENVRYFPPLLPICDDEDPVGVLNADGVPNLAELRLHNGTIYRWNRPVYDVRSDRPHLRVENRVLPSGPTVVDLLANAAFYFGMVRSLAEGDRPIWTQLNFSVAEENFQAAARDGIDAQVRWPGLGDVPATELVLNELLPLAYAGLDGFGVDPAIRDRLLGIIEGRCLTGRNGSTWQTETVRALQRDRNLDRMPAIKEMLTRYRDGLYHNEPVHLWPVT